MRSTSQISKYENEIQILLDLLVLLIDFGPRFWMLVQKLLKLLWTVYSEETLQSCLKLGNFQNPFNKDKTVGLKAIPCTKSLKGLKFAPIVELVNSNISVVK